MTKMMVIIMIIILIILIYFENDITTAISLEQSIFALPFYENKTLRNFFIVVQHPGITKITFLKHHGK